MATIATRDEFQYQVRLAIEKLLVGSEFVAMGEPVRIEALIGRQFLEAPLGPGNLSVKVAGTWSNWPFLKIG